MIDDLRRRSTAEVFEDHLRLAGEHHFEEDIERNASPDIVVLEPRGIFRDRQGVKERRDYSKKSCREHRTCTRIDW